MRGDGEDFSVSLEQERHDEATQSSLAALDAEEAAHEVAVALDALDDAERMHADANLALARAMSARVAARVAYYAALDAEARS